MPDNYKQILTHFLIYGAGIIVTKAMGFLLIPVYTHYLTTDQYGVLTLIELTSYIVAMFLGFGLTQSMLRYYYDEGNQKGRNLIMSSALILSIAISLVGLTPMLFLTDNISRIVFQTASYSTYFKIFVITLFFSLVGDIPLTYLRIKDASILYTISLFGRTVLGLTLNILFIVVFKFGIMGILVSSLITIGLNTTVLFYVTTREVKLGFSLQKVVEMFKYGLPFIPGGLGMFVLNFGDRFFLQRFSSLSEVGIYSLGYKLGMILQFVLFDPFMLIWGPKRFEFAKKKGGPEIIAKVLTYYCFIYIFGGLALAIMIKDIVAIIAAPEYQAAWRIVPIIILSYLFLAAYFITQIGILMEKRTKYIALIVTISALSNIALCRMLIPRFHSMGAAVATLCSFVLMFVLSFVVANRLYFIPVEYSRITRMVLLGLAIFAIGNHIPLNSGIDSMVIKVILILSFPCILYYLKFFGEDEMESLKKLKMGVIKRVRIPFSG